MTPEPNCSTLADVDNSAAECAASFAECRQFHGPEVEDLKDRGMESSCQRGQGSTSTWSRWRHCSTSQHRGWSVVTSAHP